MIWDTVHALASSGDLSAAPIVDHHAWTEALAKVDSLLHATGAAANWRKYLLIDRAKSDFDSSNCSPVDQRQLARDMLHRLHSTQLSREQEKLQKEAQKLEAQLSNADFVQRAPGEKVAELRARLEDIAQRTTAINQMLEALS